MAIRKHSPKTPTQELVAGMVLVFGKSAMLGYQCSNDSCKAVFIAPESPTNQVYCPICGTRYITKEAETMLMWTAEMKGTVEQKKNK